MMMETRAGPELGAAELAHRRAGRRSTSGLDPDRRRRSRRSKKAATEKAAATAPAADADAIRRAAEDSIRAMMLIRTYRVRGHLAAKLDPLGLHRQRLPGRPDPRISRLRPPTTSTGRSGSAARSASNGRPCARSSPCCRRNYCGTIGVEYMHINDLEERRFIQDRIEGKRRRNPVHARGQAGDPRQGHRGRAVGKVSRAQICRHETIRARRRRERGPGAGSGDQIWRPVRRDGDRRRHGPPRPAQRPVERHGQALSRDLPRVRGRCDQPGGRRRFGRREISPRHLVRPRVRRQQGASVAASQPVATSKRSTRSCSARRAPS